MAEGKKAFVFYCDWIETFEALSKDQGYDLLMHMLSYVNDEDPVASDPIVRAVFPNIKNTLKRDLDKWEKQYKQRKEAGKKSAESRKRKSTTVDDRSISSTVRVTDRVTVRDTVKEKEEDDVVELKNIDVTAVRVFDSDGIYPTTELAENYLLDDSITMAVIKNKDNGFDDFNHLEKMMAMFLSELLQNGETVKQCKDFNSHFRNWHKKKSSIMLSKRVKGISKTGTRFRGIL